MKAKRGFLVFDLVMMGIICMGIFLQRDGRNSDAVVLEGNEWEELCQSRKECSLDYNLYLEQTALPLYSSELGEGYLISLPNMWGGVMDEITVSEGYRIAFLDTNKLWDIETAIQEMEPLPFLIYDEEFYCKGNLFVTNLPIMALHTKQTGDEDDRERFYGEMNFFNGNKETGPRVNTSRCEFHVRGSASRVYYKMSYKLNLMNEKGDPEKLSLAGMREDDDWILRAMGLDESKIREKLATDLWNEMNTFGTYHGEYVELFLDGMYQGLYLLQEPMDFKTLGLDAENHFLIQMKTWPEDSFFWKDLEEHGQTELQCGEFIIDRNHSENLEEVYEVLEDYKRMISGESTERVQFIQDKENLYKLDVFLMTIVGVDNAAKNQFIVISRGADNTYLIRKLPWDMDASLGQMLDYCVYEDFYQLETIDETVELLMETEPETTAFGRKKMYQRMRNTVLQEEKLLKHAEELYLTLENSGVLKRENVAWGKEFGREQTEFVKAFLVRRLQWMDEYYGAL